jgi:hypothetical protein
MLMRASIAALVLASLLVLVAAASGSTPAPNVKGSVVRTTQTCPTGEACDPLPPAAFVVFSRSGHVTRVRLAASGAFALHLVPGLYAVSTAPPHGITPSSLRVPRLGVVRPRFTQRTP